MKTSTATAQSHSRRVDQLISSLNKNYKLINSAISKLTSKYKSNKIPKSEFIDTLKQCDIREDSIIIEEFLKFVTFIDSSDHNNTEKVDYQKFLLRLFNPPPITPLISKDYQKYSSQVTLQSQNQKQSSSTNTTSVASSCYRASSTPMIYNNNNNNNNYMHNNYTTTNASNHYNTCIQSTQSYSYKGRNTQLNQSFSKGNYNTYSIQQKRVATSIQPQRIETFWNEIFGVRNSYVGWRQFEASFISYFRKDMDPLILHNFLQNLYSIMKTLSSSATQLSRNWLFSVLIYSPLRQSEIQKRVAMICKDFEKNNEESEMYRSKSQNKLRSQSENTMYQSNYNFRNSKSFIDDSSKYKRAITQNTNTKSRFPSLDYTAHSKIKPFKYLQDFQKMSQKLLFRETCKYLRQAAQFFTKLCKQNESKNLYASKLNKNNTLDPSIYASITPSLTHNQSYDPQASFTYNNSFFDLNSKTMQQQYYVTGDSNKKIFSQTKGIQQTESSIEYVEDSYNDDEVYQELKQNCTQKPSNNLRQLDSQDGMKQFFKRLSLHTKDKILVQDQHKSPPPPPINLDQNRRLVSSMSVKKKRNSSLNSHYAKKYKMLKKRYAEVIYQRSMDRVHYDANNNCLQNLQQKLKQIQLEKLINQNQIGELKAQVHQMSLALQNSHHLLSFTKLDQIVMKQCLKLKVTYFHGWRLNARSQTLHQQHCLAARNMIGVLKLHNKIIENRSRKNKLILAFSKMLQGAKNCKLNQQDLMIQEGSLLSS